MKMNKFNIELDKSELDLVLENLNYRLVLEKLNYCLDLDKLNYCLGWISDSDYYDNLKLLIGKFENIKGESESESEFI